MRILKKTINWLVFSIMAVALYTTMMITLYVALTCGKCGGFLSEDTASMVAMASAFAIIATLLLSFDALRKGRRK